MSALFYIVKAICWLILGLAIDTTLDSFAVVERIPTLIGICAGIFLFEVAMDKAGGNKKLSQWVKDR